MNGFTVRFLVVSAALAPAACAQFQFVVVNGSAEQSVPAVLDLGTIPAGSMVLTHFRARNTSSTPSTLNTFAIAGAGFSVASGPALPAQVPVQGALDFAVAFQASDPGSYSAALRSDGLSALLTVAVVPALIYSVETGTGKQLLGNAPVDFGSVQVGQSKTLHFDVDNPTSQALPLPTVSVTGADFVSAGIGAGIATPLPPGGTAKFDIQFLPSAAGAQTGTLTINTQAYSLSGTGVSPPLPRPRLTVNLPAQQSGQQGSVTVTLDAPAQANGTGTLTLDFQPAPSGASDPVIAFASGGHSVLFTIAPGATQAQFGNAASALFQTGTTAGTITLTAQLGGAIDQHSIAISPATTAVNSTQATRPSGTIDVQVTGFDNTRTIGRLAFTFYDAGGNIIAPGTIQTDGRWRSASSFKGPTWGDPFSYTRSSLSPEIRRESPLSRSA
jgi:hypothetical protein